MQKKRLRADEVTDEQGRRRFHGAFTGGFSAGHFNTVGSIEGWQPKAYASSRTSRSGPISQRPEDFMDEEDGLLGRQLAPSRDFDTLGTTADEIAKRKADYASQASAIPGPAPLELTVPTSRPIGKRLLATMGWREGQGVGPRVRSRKAKRQQRHATLPQEVVAGLPEQFRETGLPTFAPENTFESVKMPSPKLDVFGLGYDVYIENPELAAFGQRLRGRSSNRTTYRTDAVALGGANDTASGTVRDASGFVIDDAEDMAYYGDSAAEFSTTIIDDIDDENDHISKLKAAAKGWADQPTEMVNSYQRCPSDGKPVLKGFKLASREQLTPLYWKPVTPPPSFTPRHHFDKPVHVDRAAGLSKGRLADVDDAIAKEQASVVETKSDLPATSVFHLMSADSVAKLNAAVRATQVKPSSADEPLAPERITAPVLETRTTRPDIAGTSSASLLKTSFAGLATAMSKRFSKGSLITDSSTTGGLVEAHELKVNEPTSQNGDQQPHRPAQRPRRRTAVWVPAPLLCKRFNVPVPDVSQGPALQQAKRKPDVFEQHIAPFIPGTNSAQAAESSTPSKTPPATLENEKAHESTSRTPSTSEDPAALNPTDLTEHQAHRPTKDVFKSIFEADSDTSSDSEEQEEDNTEEAHSLKSHTEKNSLPQQAKSDLINEDMLSKANDAPFKPVFRRPTQPAASQHRSKHVHRTTAIRPGTRGDSSTDDGSDSDKTASAYSSSDDNEPRKRPSTTSTSIGLPQQSSRNSEKRRHKHHKKHEHKRKRKHKKEKSKSEKRKKSSK